MAPPARAARSQGLRVALLTVAGTRLIAWAIAVEARLQFGRNDVNPAHYELGQFTQPFASSTANLISGVLARWDAVWYLLIANNGYDGPAGLPSPAGEDQWGASINFLPGYPAVVRLVSGLAASPEAVIVAGYGVSLASYVAALYLLYRLTELELGAEVATWAVVLLAVFPGALFFGIPYSESLFLALSVGAFYAARIERWPLAGLLGAGAALTRFPGVLLLVPLALFYLYGPAGQGPRRQIRRDAAWLLLIPGALLAYLAYTWQLTGDPLAYFHVGEAFRRGAMDPVTAFARSLSAASHGLGVLLFGANGEVDPGPQAIIDVTRLVIFVAAAALSASAVRRLPRPYGAYAVVSLLVILCTGPEAHPLDWALRYLAVAFPVFIELGRLCAGRPRVAWASAVVLAAGFAAVTTQFARWWFVG